MAYALPIEDILDDIERIPERRVYGRVAAILGMPVEIAGIDGSPSIGARCELLDRSNRRIGCEIVGFRNRPALALASGARYGVGLGSKASVREKHPVVRPTRAWLGRVLNAVDEPIDGKGPLRAGKIPTPIRNVPPPAHARASVGEKIDLGIRSINTFASCR